MCFSALEDQYKCLFFPKKGLQYHNIFLHTTQMKYFIKLMHIKIHKLKFKKFKLKPNLKAYM